METRIIGVGNSLRGDDGAGPAVIRHLRQNLIDTADLLEASGEGATLLESWEGFETVILVDAARTGSPPGTIFRFDAHAESLPTDFFHYSTHAFSVAEAVELARVLDRLPPKLIIYGIEGASFLHGVTLSPAVQEAVEDVAARIALEVAGGRPTPGSDPAGPGDTEAG